MNIRFKGTKIKDIPMVNMYLIKHFYYSDLYTYYELPEEWKDLRVYDTYTIKDNYRDFRVLVIIPNDWEDT